MTTKTPSVEVAPLQSHGELCGFLLVGRWPDTTLEWLRVLALAVRMAAIPGMLSTTTVFRVREDVPTEPPVGAVGVLLAEGTLAGDRALEPGQFADTQPAGLMVLHPPSETTPTIPELDQVASGCVLLPGLPWLGLDHRAGWIEATSEGVVTSMTSRSGVDPEADADTAVLAMLLAA